MGHYYSLTNVRNKTLCHNSRRVQDTFQNCNTNSINFKSIYSTNSISFTHYIDTDDWEAFALASEQGDFEDYGIYDENSYFDFDLISQDRRPERASYYNLGTVDLGDGYIHRFKPDRSQIKCAKGLVTGKSIIYIAPTGTGKTATAHFAVNKNLEEGKRTLISVPMIALANDKYEDFKKTYGENKVGIMTGERKVNPDAPIVILTAETLYNQAQDLEAQKDEIGTIVFDEAHFIGHPERGNIWENTIMAALQNDIQTLPLSATIGNSKKLAWWMSSLRPQTGVYMVEQKPEERYVPLVWSVYRAGQPEGERFEPIIKQGVNLEALERDKETLKPLEIEDLSDNQLHALAILYRKFHNQNEYYELTDAQYFLMRNDLLLKLENKQFETLEDFKAALKDAYGFDDSINTQVAHLLADKDTKYVKHIFEIHKNSPDYKSFIEDLKKQNMLPALIFKLSRDDCDTICKNLKQQGCDYTTDDEKKEIREIIAQFKKEGYLGLEFDEDMLLRGFAAHHAGKLPKYKKLVETLFSKKLLKVVAATSTLSVGINMPARTVVITDMSYRRFDPDTKAVEDIPLSVNEFHQMAGRAGRRGVDTLGNVVLFNVKTYPKELRAQVKEGKIDQLELAYHHIASASEPLRSSFHPDPCMMAKYYETHTDNIGLYEYINKSFKVYSAKDKDKQKVQEALYKRFDNFSLTMMKQGYLWRDHRKQLFLTPKGKLLAQAQGANPMLTASLIYDGIFDKMSVEQVCQLAGYIAGCDDTFAPAEMNDILDERFRAIIEDEEFAQILSDDFFEARKKYKAKEDSLLKALKEGKVPQSDILISDNVSGFSAFLWAYLNQNAPAQDNMSSDRTLNGNQKDAAPVEGTPDNNSLLDYSAIENFEKITGAKLDEIKGEGSEDVKKKNRQIKDYNRRIGEGNVYRTLAHTASALKQISRICKFALDHPEDYPDYEYYSNLFEKAQIGLDLMTRDPINMEDAA